MDLNTNGFGVSSPQEIQELQKAIATANYDVQPSTLTQGGALQVESLDRTLKVLTLKAKNLKLWPTITVQKAFNTTEEYNVQQSYGGETSPFFAGGGLPNSEDAQYARAAAQVKFLGTTREVTHPMALVRAAHGDVVAQQINAGGMWILQNLEKSLFDADSSVNALEFDGLDAQIRGNGALAKFNGQRAGFETGDMIIDVENADLDEEKLEDAANRIAENFGIVTDMYLDTRAHSKLSQTLLPKERASMGDGQGRAGIVLREYISSAGDVKLHGSIFNRPQKRPVAGANNAPTSVAGTDSTEAVGSQWTVADQGDYIHGVVAVYSKSGPSPVAYGSAYTQSGTNNIDVDWNAPTPPSGETILYYKIYRSEKDGASATAKYVGRVAGNVTTFRDTNAITPGTGKAYMLQQNEEVLVFKQLLPLMKKDLAVVAASYRFMVMLYGMPVMFDPRKAVIFDNIKSA